MSFGSVSIVGAGPVSLAIAVAVARIGVPVTVVRAALGDVRRAAERVDRRLGWELDAGAIDGAARAAIRERIAFSTDLGSASASDLCVESTSGDLVARRALLATLENGLSGGAVLAANAPAFQLPVLAEVLRRRDQFVGMRFFHPATHTRNVELGLLADTAPGVAAACRTFASWLAKTSVVEAEAQPRIGYREYLLGSAG